jgi:ABC-type Fe3+/spermidine/putrescine transport system ATPase subunit
MQDGVVVLDRMTSSNRNLVARDGNRGFLRIAGLSKYFGSVAAVRDVSFTVGRGEFVSLLGPSGCGKTTTLRMIAGFMSPSAGEIVLDGERIDRVPSHKRGAAMVFQNYALFPHMTVDENVGFGLRMQKVAKPEMRARVAEALQMVRLETMGARYPRELSGGQQQRVALARAVVLKPKLLLLDEPLSNLDAKLRKELRAEFLNIHRIANATTLFVTHDLEEAFSISDRVAVMNAGRLEQYDDPATIFTRPASPFVAEFVGHSNIVAGVVELDKDGLPVIRPAGSLVLHVEREIRPGFELRLAIPAHLIDVNAERVEADNCLAVEIVSAAYLGPTIHYELDAGGLLLHAEIPVRGGQKFPGRGETAFASWRAADFIRLLDGPG